MEKAQGKRTDKPLPRGGESKSDVLKSAGLSTQAASRCEKIAAIPIADTLSVGKKRVSEWLSRVVKDNKEKRDRKIFDMWLACHTQEEIAEACDCPRKTVDDQIATFGETVLGNQSAKSHAEHATDFDPPIYNIWKQQTKSEGSSHFGNSEVRWLDNLLYLYTSPFDVVVDPFAGGGLTIDICKKRFRRYFVSDRTPIPPHPDPLAQQPA